MGILDTIITTKQQESLNTFEPNRVVEEILSMLKERDKKILIHRYGLLGNQAKTLASIGQEQGLTRERVRQIEKDIIKQLRKTSSANKSFLQTKEFLINVILEHGKIIAEENLFLFLNLKTETEKNAVVFLLSLIDEIENFIHQNYKKSWVHTLFKEDVVHKFSEHSKQIFSNISSPLAAHEFLEHFKNTEFYKANQQELNDKIILNFLDLAIEIEKNVFGLWGMNFWKEIKPKDVGDKAYLVMKFHKKPEHYSVITEMINKAGFDSRTAYKETVHNELIKDKRFILIGRGIYALSEWGYKAGVVSDVIREILLENKQPLSKEKIVDEVLKRRVVKKNTILVGLSDKKQFRKVGKNLYEIAA
jgi:hypothetical protein